MEAPEVMEVTTADAFNAAKSTTGVRSMARRAFTGEALTKFEIITAFVLEVITRIRDKFSDQEGAIKQPQGILKGFRYAATGIWLIIRVIKLIRDLK